MRMSLAWRRTVKRISSSGGHGPVRRASGSRRETWRGRAESCTPGKAPPRGGGAPPPRARGAVAARRGGAGRIAARSSGSCNGGEPLPHGHHVHEVAAHLLRRSAHDEPVAGDPVEADLIRTDPVREEGL